MKNCYLSELISFKNAKGSFLVLLCWLHVCWCHDLLCLQLDSVLIFFRNNLYCNILLYFMIFRQKFNHGGRNNSLLIKT